MKLFIPLIIAAGVGVTALVYAGPSDNGLENGQRLGWDKQAKVHSVPDGGSTLALLGIGMASLAFYRFKLA
jgi:hypothetical protein